MSSFCKKIKKKQTQKEAVFLLDKFHTKFHKVVFALQKSMDKHTDSYKARQTLWKYMQTFQTH